MNGGWRVGAGGGGAGSTRGCRIRSVSRPKTACAPIGRGIDINAISHTRSERQRLTRRAIIHIEGESAPVNYSRAVQLYDSGIVRASRKKKFERPKQEDGVIARDAAGR
ncbi:hypothetical protein EVAR_6205_1 [Eumeta japonica]|uniref:Uncharacterized protein n=1 Tax=Eumeta variegata TaxID=151549 RepID=A0A4C2A5U9_EUMVA|nr:hypothetical protein EVAR_6205_1 [Eumeta japonica]